MILSGNFHQFSWKPQYKGFFHPQNPRKRTISPAYFWRHPPPQFLCNFLYFLYDRGTNILSWNPIISTVVRTLLFKKMKKICLFSVSTTSSNLPSSYNLPLCTMTWNYTFLCCLSFVVKCRLSISEFGQ